MTTILKNSQVTSDFRRCIQNGEIFQTYFSMKDNSASKQQTMTVTLPAPTEKLEVTTMEQEVTVPFYENFVCSLVFDDATKNVTPFPSTNVIKQVPKSAAKVNGYTHQSCGIMPVYKWMYGGYSETANYIETPTNAADICKGDDWTIDFDRTQIIENEDGSDVEVRCTFKRPFAAGAMREIPYNDDIDWMAGYNIYNNVDSKFRYVYGYSYESDKRNQGGQIKAYAFYVNASLTIASLAAVSALIF